MDDPLAVALQFGFLAVLYLFLLWVARSALRDLARSEEPPMPPTPRRRPPAPQRERDAARTCARASSRGSR